MSNHVQSVLEIVNRAITEGAEEKERAEREAWQRLLAVLRGEQPEDARTIVRRARELLHLEVRHLEVMAEVVAVCREGEAAAAELRELEQGSPGQRRYQVPRLRDLVLKAESARSEYPYLFDDGAWVPFIDADRHRMLQEIEHLTAAIERTIRAHFGGDDQSAQRAKFERQRDHLRRQVAWAGGEVK